MASSSSASASDVAAPAVEAPPKDLHSVDAAPHPGSKSMPPWDVGELIVPPVFRWRNLAFLIGPGLVSGAAAIGGGEWLTGPLVSARYGGALLWLATLSIVGQAIYNIEISRYTLYTGEPIFTGKFRIPPGPILWVAVYLVLDFGSVLPYLASNAAVPLFSMIFGVLPNTKQEFDVTALKTMACIIFVAALLPLVVGGKVYNSLKAIMTFKLVVVVGFLLFLAIGYSTWGTWAEIFGGFFQFGNVPVAAAEVEASATPGEWKAPVENVFVSLASGDGFPVIDLSMIGIIAAMAAICGNGGLTNTPISGYTRDQGWGMGHHVGAIPSFVGGRNISLSHVGMVFLPTKEAIKRWRGWVFHVHREQLLVWAPACVLGIALPSMLSVQFLMGKNIPDDAWLAAGMTADGVKSAVGPTLGPSFWYLTLFCGLLVLSTSLVTTSDGVLRRWVDMIWTASPHLRRWDPRHIRKLYFGVLCVYAAFGLTMLTQVDGAGLLVYSTTLYNYVLGVSCWHVLIVNTILLPRELRPSILRRTGLFFAGVFFIGIGGLVTYDKLGKFFATESETAVVAPAEDSPAETLRP